MKTRRKTALGIDVDGRHIRAALVEKTEQGVRIVAAGAGDLPAGEATPQLPPEKVLSRVIRTLGRRARARGLRTAVATSTCPQILRLLDLPRQVPPNVGEFVKNELRQYVAMSGRNMSSDFCGIGAGPGAPRRLLAVAADAAQVGETLKTCGAAGLAVESIEPAALAYARAFLTSERDASGGDALVAMLGSRDLVVLLFCKGILDFVRVREIPAGMDAPGALSAWLTEELNAVLKYCRTGVQGGGPGCRVRVVVHGSAHRKADAEHLPGIEPWVESLTVVDSCAPVTASSGPAEASGAAPSAVAVGAALRLLETSGDDLQIDLTPQEAARAKSCERRMLIAANVAALAVIGVLLIVQLLVRTTGAMDRRIEQARLDGQLYTAPALVMQDRYVDDEIRRIQSQLAALQAVRTRRDADWPAILRSVDRATPAGTCITHLAYGESRTVLLKGTSSSRDQVKLLMQNLDEEGMLGRAWLTRIQRRPDDDRLLEFEMNCIPKAVD